MTGPCVPETIAIAALIIVFVTLALIAIELTGPTTKIRYIRKDLLELRNTAEQLEKAHQDKPHRNLIQKIDNILQRTEP